MAIGGIKMVGMPKIDRAASGDGGFEIVLGIIALAGGLAAGWHAARARDRQLKSEDCDE